MRSEDEIAAEADLKQAKSVRCSSFRRSGAPQSRLWLHTQTLPAAMSADSNDAAAAARRAIRLLEDDIRRIEWLLKKLQQRFPGFVS